MAKASRQYPDDFYAAFVAPPAVGYELVEAGAHLGPSATGPVSAPGHGVLLAPPDGGPCFLSRDDVRRLAVELGIIVTTGEI